MLYTKNLIYILSIFFLVAETKGKYDKNTNVHNPEFQQLIKTIASKYQIGIHPSWFSGDYPAQMEKEKLWLEDISKKKSLVPDNTIYALVYLILFSNY